MKSYLSKISTALQKGLFRAVKFRGIVPNCPKDCKHAEAVLLYAEQNLSVFHALLAHSAQATLKMVDQMSKEEKLHIQFHQVENALKAVGVFAQHMKQDPELKQAQYITFDEVKVLLKNPLDPFFNNTICVLCNEYKKEYRKKHKGR